MKELHNEIPDRMIELGNGDTRVYFNTVEVQQEGGVQYESDYVDIEGVILYDKVVAAIIAAYYSISDELAIIRQQAEKPEEYREYYDRCESCKKTAREICGISQI